jgi:polyisoprenoid-binding protein YceI
MTQLHTEQGLVKVPAGTWKVDPAHSSVAFEVKHMMIATVRGHFSSFDGTLEADAFDSTRIQWVHGGTYRVWGDLTIKDVTREVEVEATVQGVGEDPWGTERVGVAIRGSINRTEFGLTWQQALATGGLLVGEEVKVLIDISAVRA